MTGVLTGFAAVLTIISLGYISARVGVVPRDSDKLLAKVSFNIAMPALLFTTMIEADPREIFSPLLLGVALSVGITAVLFTFLASRRLSMSERVIGALSSCYVNAGNLGIPIAAYVLHDTSLVAPVLFIQLLVIAPIGLSALDLLNSAEADRKLPWLAPLFNPVMIGALTGLVTGLLPWRLPMAALQPISLMAGAAVPLALFLYGVSLCGAFKSSVSRMPKQLWLVVVLKNFVHPVTAYLLGASVLGLSSSEVFALTTLSALPTAQNIFIYALRYKAGIALSRSAVMISTTVSVPVIVAIVAISQ